MFWREEFGTKWSSWVVDCLSTSTFYVIIGGEPKAWFHGSLFLFTLVVNFHLISRTVENGVIKGFKVGFKWIVVSHLHTILFLDKDTKYFCSALCLSSLNVFLG